MTRKGLRIWVSNLFLILVLCGCGLTLGPRVETNLIILKPGLPIEILENRTVKAHLLTDKEGAVKIFKQDIGAWISMPPEHWESIKKEMERLRKKCGEE